MAIALPSWTEEPNLKLIIAWLSKSAVMNILLIWQKLVCPTDPRTHLKSVLAIAGHTGDGNAALEQLAILRQEGVDGSAWIWVHAQNEKDPAVHRQVAEQGAWVYLDGISPSSIERHVEMVVNLKQAELLHRVLISHDAGWYSVGEPHGGTYRGFETLFVEFLPALRKAGFTDAEIELLTVTGPSKAFSIAIRTR